MKFAFLGYVGLGVLEGRVALYIFITIQIVRLRLLHVDLDGAFLKNHYSAPSALAPIPKPIYITLESLYSTLTLQDYNCLVCMNENQK